jgi:hypothetical protein
MMHPRILIATRPRQTEPDFSGIHFNISRRELTPEMHSPILWFRCIPLAVLSRFLNPDREAAKSRRAIVVG